MSDTTTLRVEGMMCQNNCGTTVHNALMSVLGVKSAVVSFSTRSAIVKGTAPAIDLIEAIDSVGFEACLMEDSPPSHSLTVLGMMCQKNCGSTVQNALRAVPGVLYAKADFGAKRADVWGDGVDIGNLITAVEDVGFEAMVEGPVSKSPKSPGLSEDAEAPDGVYWLTKKVNPHVDISKIRNILLDVAGVMSVEVDHKSQLVQVWGFADSSSLQSALHAAGFPSSHYQSMQDALAAQERHNNIADSFTDSANSLSSVASQDVVDNGSLYVMTLIVGGMSCANCSKAVETNLMKMEGVVTVRVALLSGRVEITYDVVIAGRASRRVEEAFETKVKSLGYTSHIEEHPRKLGTASTSTRVREFTFQVSGMSGPSSARDIECTLRRMAGVVDVLVSCKTEMATLKLDSTIVNCSGPRAVMSAIEGLGYWCKYIPHAGGDAASAAATGERANILEWSRLLVVALILGLPVMALHITMLCSKTAMMFFDMPGVCNGGITRGQMAMVCLNLPMQLLVGYRFYRGAFMGAMHGSFGMDCLVVTGTTITFLYSTIQLCLSCQSGIPSMHIFFETSGMLLMFVTLGKYLEAYAKGSTASAMTSLLKLQPQKAFLVTNSEDIFHSTDALCTPASLNATTPSLASASTAPKSHPLVATNGVEENKSVAAEEELAKNAERIEVLKEIDIDLVERGDIIKVFPGERVPTDGEVVRGLSYVDESLITGESVPVLRGLGHALFGSTINQKGVLYVRVTSVGSESALSQIIQLVEKAQMNKAPIQAYADVIAGVFTPCVLLLSSVTFAVWYYLSKTGHVPDNWYAEAGYGDDPLLFSLLFAIAVVVISCPCALGLATPTAIMVGTSVGAANGILIKGGPPFEIAHKVDTVIFDKTGTLTEGKPAVTDELVLTEATVVTSASAEEVEQRNHMLRLAALAEQCSEHPLAGAILHAAAKRGLTPIDNTLAEYGMHTGGVSCTFPNGTCILVGNRQHMEEHHVIFGPIVDAAMWDLEIQGKTAVCVAFNSAIVGVLGIADTIKTEAAETVAALKAMGMDVWMVTGDNKTTAAAIGDELGIPNDRIVAGALPAEKVRKVMELQEDYGRCVAMVGDGINDSPAISQANLGIAVGAGSHIAVDAADMVIVRNNLFDTVVALDLSKMVFGRIRWNLLWALLYNVMAIPVAAGVSFPLTHTILPPQYAGLCMALSSISVVVSSMALKCYKRPVGAKETTREVFPMGGSSSGYGHAGAARGSVVSRARGRLERLKKTISEKVKEMQSPDKKYARVPVGESDDLGLELGLGGLGGLPAALEYDDDDDSCFNRSL